MLELLYQKYKDSTGICTDTRKITKDSIFVSLKGANFNGNAYALKALEQGAKYAVVDEDEYCIDQRFILVKDGLAALQDLARYHRLQSDIPFIGITGSNGKTTTKELINAVLSKRYKVHYTFGNLNNHIGVPLTLLSMPADTEIAVIEMGANHIGEIEALCKIALPTHGLITNIGKAHLEGFGGLEGVARGKSELYRHLQTNKGVVFVNAQDEHLARMSTRLDNPFYYLKENAYCNPSFVSASPNIVYKTEHEEVTTQIIGLYNFNNIAAALCVGKFFDINEKLANEAISGYVSDNNRSQVIQKGSNTIILDAYNANPSSMKAALENFSEIEASLKIIVLGDMFELGKEAFGEHVSVRQSAEQVGAQTYFVGTEFAKTGEAYSDVSSFVASGKLGQIKNATILIKGSRGMKLEQLLDVFE